ncbi:MAG: hypothetical protein Q4C95_12005 [Planctomycetia bacterium]|nr:hypothetical protein [Planctomycetia bacterium]
MSESANTDLKSPACNGRADASKLQLGDESGSVFSVEGVLEEFLRRRFLVFYAINQSQNGSSKDQKIFVAVTISIKSNQIERIEHPGMSKFVE